MFFLASLSSLLAECAKARIDDKKQDAEADATCAARRYAETAAEMQLSNTFVDPTWIFLVDLSSGLSSGVQLIGYCLA
jgi:hypothetical protein